MKTISQFLDQSKRPIYSVGPNATVREALVLMAQHNIGAVLVLEGQTLAGIFSERDYARKVALKGKSSNETKVSDVMTAKVITIDTKHSIDQCMQIMTDNHIRLLEPIGYIPPAEAEDNYYRQLANSQETIVST